MKGGEDSSWSRRFYCSPWAAVQTGCEPLDLARVPVSGTGLPSLAIPLSHGLRPTSGEPVLVEAAGIEPTARRWQNPKQDAPLSAIAFRVDDEDRLEREGTGGDSGSQGGASGDSGGSGGGGPSGHESL
jgi:uncharacterized membrane protein YgcG